MVLELAENGDARSLLEKFGPFPETLCRFYFGQALNALLYIHSLGYCHRDIKLENILLDADFNFKLGDLGLATDTVNRRESLNGTLEYCAPELSACKKHSWWVVEYLVNICGLKSNYCGATVDLFALGKVLLEMKLGEHGIFE